MPLEGRYLARSLAGPRSGSANAQPWSPRRKPRVARSAQSRAQRGKDVGAIRLAPAPGPYARLQGRRVNGRPCARERGGWLYSGLATRGFSVRHRPGRSNASWGVDDIVRPLM